MINFKRKTIHIHRFIICVAAKLCGPTSIGDNLLAGTVLT